MLAPRFRSIAAITTSIVSLISLLFILDPLESVARPSTATRSTEEQRTIAVYKEANQAVVFISTVTLTVDPFDLFHNIRPQTGSGSGIIIDAERGIILTNLHVIQDAHKIEILLSDGQPYPAKLLGYDRDYDLAILQLKTPPSNLVSLPFGDSTRLEVGQRVLAIGNPFGLNKTLTTGIISSLDRTIKSPTGVLMKGLIQTDAAINPGNSGGPLLDADGNLVGINTAILSQSGDSAGIGFAVPIHEIERFLPELIATGKVLRPSFGWVLVDTNQGPMVRRVMPGGPAERAGIEPIEKIVQNVFVRGFVRDFDRADLVYKIDGKRVQTGEQAAALIARAKPIRPVTITLKRGGINGPERTLTVTPELQ